MSAHSRGRVVLGHFIPRKLYRTILGALVAEVVAFYFFVVFDGGQLAFHIYAKFGWASLPTLALGCFAPLSLLLLTVLFIRQSIFDDLRALWVENGRLVYVYRYYISAKLQQVKRISPVTYGKYDREGIEIERYTGRARIIPTRALKEPRAEILARLQDFQRSSPPSANVT
jgi:hypothetical protein